VHSAIQHQFEIRRWLPASAPGRHLLVIVGTVGKIAAAIDYVECRPDRHHAQGRLIAPVAEQIELPAATVSSGPLSCGALVMRLIDPR
jgi:hypothetical protein